MGTRWGFLNHQFSSPVPMTGTAPVPRASPSSFKGAEVHVGWWRPPGHCRTPNTVPLWPSMSPPHLPQHLLGAAGHPAIEQSSYWSSSTSALALLERDSSRLPSFLRNPHLRLFMLSQGLGTTGCRLEEKGHGHTVCCLERHHSERPPPAPSNLTVRVALHSTRFSPEKMKLHRSGPRTPLPTNPTQKIPKPRDEDNSSWSHILHPRWLCMDWTGLWFKKHRWLKE